MNTEWVSYQKKIVYNNLQSFSGLGLMEYLNWCEDLGMQPIMAVWSGFALGGTSVAEADLGPYIQQAIDQIRMHSFIPKYQ